LVDDMGCADVSYPGFRSMIRGLGRGNKGVT